jgi:hypothetical protein
MEGTTKNKLAVELHRPKEQKFKSIPSTNKQRRRRKEKKIKIITLGVEKQSFSLCLQSRD